MSDEIITIREKTTSPISISLESNGSAIDLSGIAYVRLDMKDAENKVYRYTSVDTGVTSGVIRIVTPSTGSLSFTPISSNIFRYQSSPYKLNVWIFTSSTQAYSCPEDGAAEIKLEKEF